MKKRTFFLIGTIAGLLSMIAGLAAVAAKPPAVVRLSVVIEDTLSDGITPTKINGDGVGPYINALEGVTAQFGSGGTLFANFWPQSDFGPRDISFDHSSPASYPSPETARPDLIRTPPSGVQANPHLGSNLIGQNATPIQSMSVGASQCLTFWWAFRGASVTDGQTYGWRDNFHANLADTADSLASFAVVTRNSSTTWTVESNTNQGPCPNVNQTIQEPISLVLHDTTVPGKRGNSTTSYTVKDGYYLMPFRLTLTALP